MPVRKYLPLLLLYLLTACANNMEVEEVHLDSTPLPIIERIAGYDVAHLEITAADLGLEYQKMTDVHVFQLAAIYCDSMLMAQTLAKGVDPNTELWDSHQLPEAAACPDNGFQLVKMMLDSGAYINGTDAIGENALSYAIGGGDLELVAYLLDQGADMTQQDFDDEYGCTPIHSSKTVEMLAFLLERGATLENDCTTGRTLLHTAAEEDNGELIRYLLDNELVDREAVDQNGETAYNYATANASVEAQELLRP
jgi:ankyrin repeat protein